MKSSLKFREEKSPLLRAKLPFKVGPIPLSSGVAVGHKQELAVHLGTIFPAGPVIKFAFKPHDPNPLSVILKTGLGLWGSPNDAPLTLSAEFRLTANGSNRLLSLCLKPRAGDFSIRKEVNIINFPPAEDKQVTAASVRLQVGSGDSQNHVTTPCKAENGLVLSSLSNGDVKESHKHTGTYIEKEQGCNSAVDSSTVVTGSIEGVDKDWRGRNDRNHKVEGIQEQDGEADNKSGNGNGMILHVPCQMLHEHMEVRSRKSSGSFSFVNAQSALQGFKIVTHSSLPLGSQGKLNVQWGVKSPAEFFQGWDGSLSSVSFSKLPSLLLDKISFERITSHTEKPVKKPAGPGTTSNLERGLISVSFLEENNELAQVATMCYTMKRQLHLMYAENQVLRRAMEEMRSQVESRSSWTPLGAEDGLTTHGGKSLPRAPPTKVDAPRAPREGPQREAQAHKGQKILPRKDEGTDHDVSKELEKAIMNAKTGSVAGK